MFSGIRNVSQGRITIVDVIVVVVPYPSQLGGKQSQRGRSTLMPFAILCNVGYILMTIGPDTLRSALK